MRQFHAMLKTATPPSKAFKAVLVHGFAVLLFSGIALAQTPSPTTDKPQSATTSSETKPAAQAATGQAAAAPSAKAAERKPAAKEAAQERKAQESASDTSAPATATPQEPMVPTVTKFPAPREVVGVGALVEPEPLPKGRISLIGGTVHSIDQIRNKMTLQIFGGKKMKMFFDDRSRVYRNGVETTQMAIKKGDRIYVDTQLDKGKIFARNLQVKTTVEDAGATGQVLDFDASSGELRLRDQLSGAPARFRVTPETAFKQNEKPGSKAELVPGALVSLKFNTSNKSRGVVTEVTLLARPGEAFTFMGTLTHLDLRNGLLGLRNKSDDKLYEIRFSPSRLDVNDELAVGAEVTIVATFAGQEYAAQTLAVNRTAIPVTDQENGDEQEKPKSKK